MNGWELLEVREMALRDLVDFIPPNLYGTLQVRDAAIDIQLGKELKLSSKPEHARMTIRQRRAANLLWRIGMYTGVAEELQHIEEEWKRESIEKSLAVLRDNLSPVLKEYAECISEEERKFLPILKEENINHQDTLKDSERNSLLKMIIGMAIEGYCYDPTASKNDAVSDITKDLEKLGISLSDDTVRKYLKMAVAQLPRKPRQV